MCTWILLYFNSTCSECEAIVISTVALQQLQIIHMLSELGLQIQGSNILIVGETTSLICSSDLDISSIEWLYSGQVVASSTSQQELELEFSPVNDTIHGREYTCRVISPYGSQEETISVVAEGELSDCIATQNSKGVITLHMLSRPGIQWCLKFYIFVDLFSLLQFCFYVDTEV